MKNILVVGGSNGLGAALVQELRSIAQAMYDIQNIQLRQKLISNMELQLKNLILNNK